MNCEKHTDLSERIAVVEVKIEKQEKLTQEIHDDHENSKKELSKIKVLITKWSTVGALVGSGLFKLISDIDLAWVKHTINYCKAIWYAFFPDSYAGY